MKNISRGFTLIEVLVVIAIIVVLTGIIMASFSGAQSSARDRQRIADLKELQLKLEQYRSNNRQYPDDLDTLEDSGYISKTPNDPKKDPSGNIVKYGYDTSNNLTCDSTGKPTEYTLTAVLENNREEAFEETDAAGVTVYKYILCDPFNNPL